MAMFLILLFSFSNSGVIIVDNVWFYGDDHKMRILNTGDLVEIIEIINDRTKIEYDSAFGQIDKNVLIDLNDVIAEDELFVFSRGYFDDGEYKKASRLFGVFIENFDESKYLAENLYYLGQSYEALANNFSNIDSIPHIVLNEHYNRWYYDGDAYQELLERFPDSPYAAKAQYRLISISRAGNQPWHDSIALIEEELKRWQQFVGEYKNTDEYVLGLLEIGYLNRVLYEITEDLKYKDEAINIFTKIIYEYPNTIHYASARVNISEIMKGRNIYKY